MKMAITEYIEPILRKNLKLQKSLSELGTEVIILDSAGKIETVSPGVHKLIPTLENKKFIISKNITSEVLPLNDRTIKILTIPIQTKKGEINRTACLVSDITLEMELDKEIESSYNQILNQNKEFIKISEKLQESEKLLNEKVKELEQSDAASLNIMDDLQDTLNKFQQSQDIIKQQNTKLTESEKRFRLISETSPAGIFEMNKEGFCNYSNTKFRDIFNLTMQQSMRIKLQDLIPAEERDSFWTECSTMMQQLKHFSKICQLNDLKQNARWIQLEISPMITDDEVKFTGIIQDITAMKKVEEKLRENADEFQTMNEELVKSQEEREDYVAQLQEKTAALEIMNDKILKSDAETKQMLFWQQGANSLQQSLLAPSPLESKIKNITDSIVNIFDADFCRLWLIQQGDRCEQGCIHAKVTEGPHVCRYRDKCLHLIASSGRYTHIDGEVHRRVPFGCYKIGRVASQEDRKFITNDAQNDTRVHNNKWARELGLVSFAGYQLKVPGEDTLGVLALFAKHQITPAEDAMLDGLSSAVALVIRESMINKALIESKKEIECQNINLQKLDQLKSSFLNITSHELRTPMSAIKGYTQMVMKQTLGAVTEEQKKALDVVLRNTNRLDHLIQDILDISRLESGTMKFIQETSKPYKMIQEIVENMRSAADIKHIQLVIEIKEELPDIFIDSERVKQVVMNLINNAIKFSPENTNIILRVKKQDESLLFEVQDFGRGIPAEKQDKIFETFYQVDSGMDRKFGGAGLGLSISRGIILAHGGKIWVESEVGKGSIFKFILPLKPVADLENSFKELDIFQVKTTKKEVITVEGGAMHGKN